MHYALKSIIKMLFFWEVALFLRIFFQKNIDFIKYKLRIQHTLFLEHCVEGEYGM